MHGFDARSRWITARALATIPCVLVLASFCVAQPLDTGTASDSTPDSALWVAMLAGFVLPPLLLWGVRRLLVRRIRQRMLLASAEQTADPVQSGVEEAAAAAPVFERYDADRADTRGGDARRRREREALQLFRRVCLVDLAAAGLYAGLPALFGLLSPNLATFGGWYLTVAIIGFTAFRYGLHRRQGRAFDLSRSRARQGIYRRLGWLWRGLLVIISLASGGTAINLIHLPDILRAIFGARMRTWLSIGAVIYAVTVGIVALAGGPEPTTRTAGLGLLLAAIAHAVLFTALGRRWRAVPGIRLLILRVFDIDATSSFVFSGLMKYWRHFGNHFTVVDPSLVRQDHTNNEWRTGFIVAGSWGALLFFMVGVTQQFGEPQLWSEALALAAAPSLMVGGVAAVTGLYRIDSRFIGRRDQLVQQADDLVRVPRSFDLRFRHARVLCYDNTWFHAIVEFSRRAHVVLMDLRGYTAQRKGCQREVDFLFDTVPLQRLLFLVDAATDDTTVCAMLLERWAALQDGSPNLRLRAPAIQLYVLRDSDERDMQAILDRLIEFADAPQRLDEDEGPAGAGHDGSLSPTHV